MKVFNKTVAIIITLLALPAFSAGLTDPGGISLPELPPSHASTPLDLFVHKSADGGLSETALANLARLQNHAGVNGSVKVWVTFKMAFESDPVLRTEEVIAAEAEEREVLMQSQIYGLVESGVVELLSTPAYLSQAPGCMVRATGQGLGELAYSDQIQHLKTMR